MKVKILKIFVVAILLFVGIVIYFSLDPGTHHFPRCPFLSVTGLKCPGCGSQRAIHALLHGDLALAMTFNAFLVLAIPLVVLLLLGLLLQNRYPRLNEHLNSLPSIIGVGSLIVAWWIARNVWNW